MTDQWVLDIVRGGYQIPLVHTPPLNIFRQTPLPHDPVKRLDMLKGVKDLLTKGAICPVPASQRGLGFYSILFLVPKPEGK